MLGTKGLEGSWDRSVTVAPELCSAWPRKCGSNSKRGTNFCGVHNIEAVLRSSQLHVHVSHCVQWMWQECSHSCLSSAKMNVWTRTPPPPFGFTAWYLIKHTEGSLQYILSCWWIVHTVVVFPVLTMHSVLILSLQKSKLPPSSGWCNVKVMTSFKHQFWLCCLVGLTGYLAVNNLTSLSQFISNIQIIFSQSVHIKRFNNTQGQYLFDYSQHSSLRPVHLPLHSISSFHTTL